MSSPTATSEDRVLPFSDTSSFTPETSADASLSTRLNQLSKRPLAFWFLNQWLEEEELSRQIAELKEKGFGGFFMHPRGGLEIPYGSRRWYDIIEYCVREAKRVGLEPWLYDEDPYPSGAAGGQVTLENPAFRAVELKPHRVEFSQVGEVAVDLPPGMLHAVYLKDDEGVHRIDEEAGVVRTEWNQGMRYHSYYPPYANEGTPHWRGETHSPHFRVVTFIRKAPATLVAFVKVPVLQNPWGDYPDLMNEEAVDAFIRLTHERYFQRLGTELGGTVPGIFTDESKVRGFIPWTPDIDRWTKEVGGVSLNEMLLHLVLDLDESTLWHRWAFREAVARAFLAGFIDRVRAACDRFGLLWTGHFSPEEDPIAQALYIPGLFRVLGRMEIPGTDLIGVNLGSPSHPLLHLSPKLASSVAHLSGKPYTSCEALAVGDWVQDFSFITRAVHWLFALGVNRIVTHGQYYSIDGLRKREAPPSQFYQAAGWEHMPALMEQIICLSNELSKGEHRAPVLLYYPEETFMALALDPNSKQRHTLPTEAWVQREKLGQLLHQLLIRGYDFDLIDAESLLQVSVNEDKELVPKGNQKKHYQLIVVPGSYLTPQTWEHLRRIRKHGATVCFVEREVTILQSLPCKKQSREDAEGMLFDQLAEQITPLWKSEGQLIGHLRDTDDGPRLFLCNNSPCPFNGGVTLIFPGPYEVCDPAEGQWRLAGESLSLELSAGLGVLIRQARQGNLHHYLPSSNWKAIEAHWRNWSARPISENALFLHQFSMITRPSRSPERWRKLLETKGHLEADLPDGEIFQTGRMIDLASPASAQMQPVNDGDRYMMTAFDWVGPVGDIRLVCDSNLLPAPFHKSLPQGIFFLNGNPLPALSRRRTFDPMNLEASLSGMIREGRNRLLWVQPSGSETGQKLPYDGLRLFGDFQVEFPFAHSSLVALSLRPSTYSCGGPMPPQLFGHAHYPGIIEYTCDVSLPRLPERIALRFQKVYESMEVIINGHNAGHLWSEPYLLEITPTLLQVGTNRLMLRCATSPANYLQGLQRPAGCLGPVEWCTV